MSTLQCLCLFCHSLDEQFNSFWLLSFYNRRSANFSFYYLLTCHFLLPLREYELIASLTCRSIAITYVTPVALVSANSTKGSFVKIFQTIPGSQSSISEKYSLQLGQKSQLHFSPNSFQLQLWCYYTHLPHFCDTFCFCLFVCLFTCCHSWFVGWRQIKVSLRKKSNLLKRKKSVIEDFENFQTWVDFFASYISTSKQTYSYEVWFLDAISLDSFEFWMTAWFSASRVQIPATHTSEKIRGKPVSEHCQKP